MDLSLRRGEPYADRSVQRKTISLRLPPRPRPFIKTHEIERAGIPCLLVCRTFHAFHLPGNRIDPGPAAAGGLDRGAGAGGAVADRDAAVLSRAPVRPCDGPGLWSGIPGRQRARPALVVLAPPPPPPPPAPPLSFWLADIAYRAAGNHMIGVYLLAELCSVATLWILFLLGRALVGAEHAVLAVLLTMTVTAFGARTLEFGPDVLARPLWALLLLHTWELIGQRRRNVWFAWSIDAGLLLLTTPSAIMLLVLVAGFALATEEGRRPLRSFDPFFAQLVIAVLALPYLIFLLRADAAGPHWPMLSGLETRATHLGWVGGGGFFA